MRDSQCKGTTIQTCHFSGYLLLHILGHHYFVKTPLLDPREPPATNLVTIACEGHLVESSLHRRLQKEATDIEEAIIPMNDNNKGTHSSYSTGRARAEGNLRVSCKPVEGEVELLGSIPVNNMEGPHCRFLTKNVGGAQVDMAGHHVRDGHQL